jgi:hypothetical protein
MCHRIEIVSESWLVNKSPAGIFGEVHCGTVLSGKSRSCHPGPYKTWTRPAWIGRKM